MIFDRIFDLYLADRCERITESNNRRRSEWSGSGPREMSRTDAVRCPFTALDVSRISSEYLQMRLEATRFDSVRIYLMTGQSRTKHGQQALWIYRRICVMYVLVHFYAGPLGMVKLAVGNGPIKILGKIIGRL